MPCDAVACGRDFTVIATAPAVAESMLREALYACDDDAELHMDGNLMAQVPEEVAIEELR